MMPSRGITEDPFTVSFKVPLHFSKLDLRDYLHNLYGVDALKVRSWVALSKPTRAQTRTGEGKWYRPMSKKYMAVRLKEPFVVPEKPADLKPWDNDLYSIMFKGHWQRAVAKQGHLHGAPQMLKKPMTFNDKIIPRPLVPHIKPTKQIIMRDLKKQASQLLSGRKKWDNGIALDPKWDAQVADLKRRQEERGLERKKKRKELDMSDGNAAIDP